jgi:hypothetical protein
MGFVHFRLSAGVHFGCPLPGTLRFPLAEQCHLLDRVPPSRFLTALTASSTRVLRACCIPHPTMRFAAFLSLVASTTLRRSCASPRLPRDAHTLRRIPLASSRTASPRPLPSCRFRSLRTPLCGGSRLRTLPTLVGSVRLPPQVNLARGTSRSAEAARSVDLPLPRRSGSGSVRPSPRPAEAGPGWATPSPLHAWARSGSGCRPPAPPERLGFALAAGFVRRFHPPWRPKPLGLLTPSRSLAEAGSLAGDCTQSRDVVGSVGARSPRLGLR